MLSNLSSFPDCSYETILVACSGQDPVVGHAGVLQLATAEAGSGGGAMPVLGLLGVYTCVAGTLA